MVELVGTIEAQVVLQRLRVSSIIERGSTEILGTIASDDTIFVIPKPIENTINNG